MARVKITLHEPPAKPGNSTILQIIKYKISTCLCAPQNHPVVLGVADADVARDALCESYARPVAKHGRHVGTTMCFRCSWNDGNLGIPEMHSAYLKTRGEKKREELVVPLSWFGPRPRLSTSTSISASSSALVFIVTILVWDRLSVAVPLMVGGAISNPVFSNIRP